MEKQNKVYLSFAALSLIGGIVMTTIDLRQANHITHSTALGYLLAALFVSLFLTNRRGMFKVTCCLGCILACILSFAEVLLILKSDSLGLGLRISNPGQRNDFRSFSLRSYCGIRQFFYGA